MNDARPARVKAVADGFWNIRGSFRLGPVDLGTHTSLVRLADGRHVFLDAYTLDDETRRWAETTMGDAGPAAIINLHPFHTVHVEAMASAFPNAKLYGTARHHERFAGLRWEKERTEDEAFAALFDADFSFSVPRGVDFVPKNPNLHFASVVALHRSSRVMHVDDTLVVAKLPKPLRSLKREVVSMHPTLAVVLERRTGAAAAFRTWTKELVELGRQADTLCAAHSAIVTAGDDGRTIADRIESALKLVRPVVELHERRYG